MRRIDRVAKLRHFVQTAAFCLVIATIQYSFTPDRPYAPQVAYSLAIGLTIWAVIDLGRDLFPSTAETGWPRGIAGVLLPVAGIAIGFLFGNFAGDLLCRTLGLYGSGPPVDHSMDLRNSIIVTAIAGVVGSYYFYSMNRSAYLERQMGEARQHAQDARLKLLETQLEPHMLFNTLANLRVLIGVDPPRAQAMLDHMIAYLRATLDASRATQHSVQAEFDRLRDYLELMAIRMGPRLRFSIDLPDDVAGARVPTLLLQPLVENSIKHGLEPKVEGGSIAVSARSDGTHLVLEVRDTGVGASAAQPHARKGFGLAQVRERLQAVYGAAASMQFDAEPGRGAHTVIRLPLAT